MPLFIRVGENPDPINFGGTDTAVPALQICHIKRK
jgi:hypothetical protein